MGPFWAVPGASWEPLGGVLGASWGGVLGLLGGLLEPLGGQDPPEARGMRVLEASWGRLELIFGFFLDGFFFLMNFQHFSYLILQDINMS